MFHSEARQFLIGAQVYNKGGTPLDCRPAKNLEAKDFHVYENGREQSINFVRETDFRGGEITNQWWLEPTRRGIWGTPMVVSFDPRRKVFVMKCSTASYLIGYAPSELAQGECRTVKVQVAGREVYQNRTQYCNSDNAALLTGSELHGAQLGEQMLTFATSSETGSIDVSAAAFSFRSSGVAQFAKRIVSPQNEPVLTEPEFRFVLEVHDAKAPARIQVATEFASPGIQQNWVNGYRHISLHVLGIVYNKSGDVVGQFGDSYEGDRNAWLFPSDFIPRWCDVETELPPGDYQVRVVVSDGKNFGRATLPLQVEKFDGRRLSISDIVLSNSFRPASALLEDEAAVSPAPLVPTPLVSKDVQFFPAASSRFSKKRATSVYFELYEPLLETQNPSVSFEMRITDSKTGEVKMNTGPMSAAAWVQPGNAVIPIAVSVAIERLITGSYTLEVQASDSAGRTTDRRAVNFSVE